MERCDECGFEFDQNAFTTVSTRIISAAHEVASLLDPNSEALTKRPQPDRWSALEYAAHVRDVLAMMRERIVIGLVEDNPTFAPMYRDQRVNFGLYAKDEAGPLSTEIEAVAAMLARMYAQLSPAQLVRPVRYGFPNPIDRTVGWMGLQAIHEAVHHARDIASNIAP